MFFIFLAEESEEEHQDETKDIEYIKKHHSKKYINFDILFILQ